MDIILQQEQQVAHKYQQEALLRQETLNQQNAQQDHIQMLQELLHAHHALPELSQDYPEPQTNHLVSNAQMVHFLQQDPHLVHLHQLVVMQSLEMLKPLNAQQEHIQLPQVPHHALSAQPEHLQALLEQTVLQLAPNAQLARTAPRVLEIARSHQVVAMQF